MRLRPRTATLLAFAAALRPVLSVEPADGSALLFARQITPIGNVTTPPPDCALQCLAASLSDPQCSTQACVCSNTTIQDKAGQCVLAACSLADALLTKNYTENSCGRAPRNRKATFNDTTIILGSISAAFVIVRLFFKRFVSARRALGADDWTMLTTGVLGIPATVVNLQGLSNHGLGKDIWTLPISEITSFIRYFYIQEIFYPLLQSLIKVSFTFFYLAIFPGMVTRRILWGTLIYNVLFGIAFVFAAVFQCTPIHYFWTQFESPGTGGCINFHVLGWLQGIINILTDVWMIAIPLILVSRLQLHWKKKIGVSIMFVVGTLATIVSILRLQSLIHFADTQNPTYDFLNVVLWSTIEINCAIICACLPAARMILVYFAPRIFSTTAHESQDSSHSSQSATHHHHKFHVRKQIRVSTSSEHALDNIPRRAESWEDDRERLSDERPIRPEYRNDVEQ